MNIDFTEWISEAGGSNIAAISVSTIVLIRLSLAPYWLWREEHQRVIGFEERERTKLRCYFDGSDDQCNIVIPPPDSVAGRYFQIKVEAVSINQASECAGRLVSVTAPNGYTHNLNLHIPFSPFEHDDAVAKRIQRGIPEYLNTIRVSDSNIISFIADTPKSINVRNMFRDVGDYKFKIVVSSASSPVATTEAIFRWTGDWHTASMMMAR